MVYRCTYDSPITTQAEEIISVEFLSLERLDQMMKEKSFCPDGASILQRYRRECL